jgi:hypothetical protein
MSWAARRKAVYAAGVFLFFATLFGGPLVYWYLNIPATCEDGIQNQRETSPDRGGPCQLLDGEALTQSSVLWVRGFRIRDGLYSAVAYIQNANSEAGIRSIRYRFSMYDDRNVLVTEREGSTYIMPAGVTPIFEGGIDTGNRAVAHTYFEFTEAPLWERLFDTSHTITVEGSVVVDTATMPRVTATVGNTSVREMRDVHFVAIVSDPAGNAFAASQTALPILSPGAREEITFTWPAPFNVTVGRISIIPLIAPEVER